MSIVKLKTNQEWKAGQTNILPFVGTVKYDESATIEVSEENAKKLMEFSSEFFLPDEEGGDIGKKSEDSEELDKSEEQDLNPQTDDSEVLGESKTSQEIEMLIREKLEALTVKEIKEQYLSKFSKELIKDLKNKEQYIDFLVGQLSK